MSDERVEFSAKVPREEYDRFKENFPQYGAVNWFINTCLLEFNRQVDQNPSAMELVNDSIQKMLEFNREQRLA